MSSTNNIRPLNKARLMAIQSAQKSENTNTNTTNGKKYHDQFDQLVNSSNDEQLAHFLKSFIFALGDSWKECHTLATEFNKYLADHNEKKDLDIIQAADLLQKKGLTRTALQRKQELLDIDLNQDGRISLTEYFLLHYKGMILSEYFKRHNIAPTVSLENNAIGVTSVGDFLVEELFTFPIGLDPALQKAIDEFLASKKQKEEKIKNLQQKAALGGVKGLTAQAELLQIGAQDQTGENRVEITLKAAQRRSSGVSAEQTLKQKQELEEKSQLEKRRASRAALAAKAAQFEKGVSA
jgi:hypothetical protein